MYSVISREPNSQVVPLRPRILLQHLDAELELLRAAVAKIKPHSKEQWALPIYQRIICRHERLRKSVAVG